MSRQLVVGAGLIGGGVARRLAAHGDDVVIASRHGTAVDGARALALDATDADAFAAAASGAATIFLCTNPPYTRWPTDWPPVFAAAIDAATRSGAGLVIMSNLYGYGPPEGPMTEDSPELSTETKGRVRLAGWHAALAAHERGDIRAVEVRASDYFGPGATGTAHLGESFFHAAEKSKTARVVGDPALPHSWSYLPDIVSTLIAAADYEGAWGRVWHVPSGQPRARTVIMEQLNEHYGGHGRVAGYPQWVLRALAAVSPLMREIEASSYQFRMPFVIDSAQTERLLGVSATGWLEALTTTADAYR
ncbi:NAD-dependent epimerase/dehydratase family protein [Microterricola viridarii]|uniref:Nucleoside-diphosphate-sugar epimerase n=1 Tax=Microterricola viridarii TaxID=412690 RepID=A0A1H1RR70_9MICO|nr:NAD-dependent epimerase/dehydratase family protein [Microterricola viridarii]SDS38163.1 Nucleoside-diphosphate-sugar epimerase [Microterricola viridarii]